MVDIDSLDDSDSSDWPQSATGEQTIVYDDFVAEPKAWGVWFCLNFHVRSSGQKARYTANFRPKDTDPKLKQNHEIGMRGIRDFLKAAGYAEADLPGKPTARDIAKILDKMVVGNGDGAAVKAFLSEDDRGNLNASKFRAA